MRTARHVKKNSESGTPKTSKRDAEGPSTICQYVTTWGCFPGKVSPSFFWDRKQLGRTYEPLCTCGQVSNSEAVLDQVAGLAVPPTLQAGVLLQRRLQHVVTAQALKGTRVRRCFRGSEKFRIRPQTAASCKGDEGGVRSKGKARKLHENRTRTRRCLTFPQSEGNPLSCWSAPLNVSVLIKEAVLLSTLQRR